MKKIIRFILLFTLALAAQSIFSDVSTPITDIREPETPSMNGWLNRYVAKEPTRIAEKWSREKLARVLLKQFFEHFKSADAGSKHRIEEFKIHEVRIFDVDKSDPERSNNCDYGVHATYSVRTTIWNFSDWRAGNGHEASGNWMRNKGEFFGVYKKDSDHCLKRIGTGW